MTCEYISSAGISMRFTGSIGNGSKSGILTGQLMTGSNSALMPAIVLARAIIKNLPWWTALLRFWAAWTSAQVVGMIATIAPIIATELTLIKIPTAFSTIFIPFTRAG